MLIKSECEHCGEHIEFDHGGIGQTVQCPHCGKDTTLRPLPTSSPPAINYTPRSKPNPNLRICRDCGKELSIRAESCPHCGATYKRRHGVFYYVFWGVISLFVTLMIISFATGFLTIGIPAFLAARREAQHRVANHLPSRNGGETNTNSSGTIQSEKLEYIKSQVQLYDFTARYFDSALDGKVPGVDFKIRNAGTRILKRVEVSIYFKDRSGKIIAEKQFNPVLVSQYAFGENNAPLKPNYIWQMERGKFYAAKNVPSEWQEGNAEARITDIDFAEESQTQE